MRPKNWSKFQHYKDRRPPWIRLYHHLIDDPAWWRLSGDDSKCLVAIWLVASENENGELPPLSDLAFRLRMPEKRCEQTIERLSAWLEQSGNEMLAKRARHAVPETEAEERRAEGEGGASAPPPAPLRVAECVQADWEADEEAAIPDDLPAGPMGAFLLQRLSIPHSYGLAVKFADAVDLLARDEDCARGEAARRLLERVRENPPADRKWRFWLEDGGWKKAQTVGVSTEGLE